MAAQHATTLPIGAHLVFEGKDYAAWKIRVERELRYILKCPRALDPTPDAETPEQTNARTEQEERAYGAIFSRLNNDMVLLVRDARNIREVFQILDAQYSARSSLTVLNIQAQLERMQLNPHGDPQKFFVKLDALFAALTESGKIVTDEDKSLRYLACLPPSMFAISQTCASLMVIQNYTSTHIRCTIIQQCANMKLDSRTKTDQTDSKQNKNSNGQQTNGSNANGKNGGNRNGGNRNGNGHPRPSTSQSTCNQTKMTSQQNGENDSENASACKVTKRSGYRGKHFDKSKATCFKCNKKGHLANECDQKQANFVHYSQEDVEKFADMCLAVDEPFNVEEDDEKFAEMCLAVEEPTDTDENGPEEIMFMGDSGANYHISNEKPEYLINVKELIGDDQIVRLAKKKVVMRATLQGDLPVTCMVNGIEKHSILKNVLYVPDADHNFLSTTRYMKNGYAFHGEDGIITVTDPEKQEIMQGKLSSNPTKIIIRFLVNPQELIAMACMKQNDIGTLMHKRFGHMNSHYVEQLRKLTVGAPGRYEVLENVTTCETCANSKMKKLPHDKVRDRATRPLELIHCDLMGKIEPMAENDSQYVLVIIDDWTHYTVTFNLKTKNDAVSKMILYIKQVNNISEHKVSRVRCDNGGEFVNDEFIKFCEDNGIDLDVIPPYTPQLNAVVERMNGTLGNRIRALLYNSFLPIEWWHLAADTATYLINRSPTAALEETTPYERWHKKKPDISHIRIFGSVARVFIPPENRKKLDKRSWRGILVGFTKNGYKIYDIRTREVVISRDVKIDESKDIREVSLALTQNRNQALVIHRRPIIDINNIENVIIANNCVSENYDNPATFEEAMSMPDREEWSKAIEYEFDILEQRKVWEVVPKPTNQKLMDTKWVLRRKIEGGGRIRYRARLCARGFKDMNHYEVNETYSPTARLSTVRLLLVMAVEENWDITHLDVTSAFLYGELKKETLISIPKGMKLDSNKYALSLKRALYGLKVASNSWRSKVEKLFGEFGYVPLVSEPSIFVFKDAPMETMILVFVDDILVTGSNRKRIAAVISSLASKVEIKNLGVPQKFLGIEIKVSPNSITLNQTSYIQQLVNRFPIGRSSFMTPMETNLKLSRPKEPEADVHIREILGSLMYASVGTRPDISYAVNYLCRFQDCPTGELLKYAKRVLSYLYRTKEHSIVYRKSPTKQKDVLTVYTDASFASDLEDRKSTSGVLVKLGENSIHWRTTKQKCVTKSTCEAEYIAMSLGDSEIRAVSNILSELQYPHRMVMGVDNSGAIAIAEKRDSTNCCHIDVAYRAVEETLGSGRMSVVHVKGSELEADLLTKSLPKEKHTILSQSIMNYQ